MSIPALQSAASGMRALDQNLDILANNLANINTVGFKGSRANFEDLFYQVKRQPGMFNTIDQEPHPHGLLVGLGSVISGTQFDLTQGPFEATGRALDLGLEGEGFFQVTTLWQGQETIAYTRAGNFVRNSEGELVLANSDGSKIEPPITIPEDATDLTVANNGQVLYHIPGDPTFQEAGQIELARFVNAEGMLTIGKNLLVETDASGQPVTGYPGEEGLAVIRSGVLEQSNVDPVRELIDLIKTQRYFELNGQSIRSADRMLQLISNLGRF
jgi:flagellar basal-body rod protein FlgG